LDTEHEGGQGESLAHSLFLVLQLRTSTCADAKLEESLALQLAGAPFTGRVTLPDARAFAELAGKFYGSFWRDRFQSARFRFTNPRVMEKDLGAAEHA